MNILRSITFAVVAFFAMTVTAVAEPVKVGFVYVGPIGDHGWTYRHDIGRQQVEEAFGDKVETVYIESVQYGPEAERVIRQMAKSGVDIIFATSFGYMEPMLKVAKEFPDVKFEHATGYKRHDNMSTYGLRLYQARHVQGIIAGMMTKTNKICYVGAYPIPEVIREINTYYMGAKKMNPDVDIDVVWVNTWYDPAKEADAANVMMAEGCDMVAQHTDSPAPLQAAQQQGKLGFGQASDQINFAPKAQLTATIDNWGPYYIKKVGQVIEGNWQVEDYFGHMNEDAVQMAPFTNMPADVEAKAQSIKDAISNGEYFAFTGPLKDNTGKLQLADGEVASDEHLNTMMYYVEGIDATVPK
ncbi:MAG: BMP family ABC transporter substrate-binding protein [Legionellales bacterium]|nr:BMP family ABC transporter substrate-binding protein [Legionellales bacterium]